MKILVDLRGRALVPYGGETRRMQAMAEHLSRLPGIAVDRLVDPRDDEAGPVVRVAPRGPGASNRLAKLSQEYDLIVGAEAASWARGAATVASVRAIPSDRGGPRPARSLTAAERILVPHRGLSDALIAVRPALQPGIRIVQDGIDSRLFHPSPVPEDLQVLERHQLVRERYMLCVGALDGRHGTETALAVRQGLADRGIDMPLILVGQGEVLPEEDLLVLSARHPGQRIGQVLRDVGDQELASLLRHARLVLAPAPESTSALVPLEALSCGTPTLVADQPGHRERLGRGVVRYLPPHDGAAWVQAVLLEHYERSIGPLEREAGLQLAAAATWERTLAPFLEEVAEGVLLRPRR